MLDRLGRIWYWH